MLVEFLAHLRRAQLPVSTTEYLALMEALSENIAEYRIENFYRLSRTILIKDERLLDRFDRAFGAYFKDRSNWFDDGLDQIPEQWLLRQAELLLSEEEKSHIEALGGWDTLMQTLHQRLREQRTRHQGGNKWIGTAGRSPFGAYGYHPEGVRIGQSQSRNHRAVKVWDKRQYADLDDGATIGTRHIQIALRKLRRFAREGSREEFDLQSTIDHTARNAGWLDVRMVPERHNAIKVLLFIDVGGSMYPFVQTCEQLFSAARSEFKHLEHFYFHNFFYDSVWRSNRRRHEESLSLLELTRTYGRDYKIIVVGDASMSPYEIKIPGGSVEFWNEEAGEVWAKRLLKAWPNAVWLNPVPVERWSYTQSIAMVRELMQDRMFPLTIAGLDSAISALKHGAR